MVYEFLRDAVSPSDPGPAGPEGETAILGFEETRFPPKEYHDTCVGHVRVLRFVTKRRRAVSRARAFHAIAVSFAAAAQAAYASPAARDDRGLRRSVSTILSEFDGFNGGGKHDGLLSRPLLGSARSRSSGYHKKV